MSKKEEDIVTKTSILIDKYLFQIRSMINLSFGIGTILLIRSTKYGKRITTKTNMKLYGRFIVAKRLYFYHEPFFLRLLTGRKRIEKINYNNCIVVSNDGHKYSSIHGLFGILQNDNIFVRMKWFHIQRTKVI